MPPIRHRQMQQPHAPVDQPLTMSIIRPFRRQRVRHPDLARPEHRGMTAHLQPGVHHHAHGLALHRHMAHGHGRIVGPHGAAARQDGTGPRPPGMAVGPGCFAGDPLALARGQRNEAIQRSRGLDAHPWPAPLHPGNESLIQFVCLLAQQSTPNIDTGSPQTRQPLAVDQRVGIFHGGHHARHPRLDQPVGTGRRPAVMRTGFERDIGRGTASPLSRLAQRMHLRMRLTRPLMPALTHHLAIANDNAAHPRVGHGGAEPLPCQIEGTLHEPLVVCVEHQRLREGWPARDAMAAPGGTGAGEGAGTPSPAGVPSGARAPIS